MKFRRDPEGVHLFDRQTGLNIIIDEIRPNAQFWSIGPRYISFALTNACDLSCHYCYAAKELARLKYDDLIRWSIELDEAGTLGIGLGGGEPTLYPKFVDLCKEISNNTDLALTMTTHGHQFTHQLSRNLSNHINFIRLSMDGIGATYETLRGRPFPDFIEKLKLVRDTASFGINYVVNHHTIDLMDEAAYLATENGAEEILLLPELKPNGEIAISQEVLSRLECWIQDNQTRYHLVTSNQGALSMDIPILPISESSDSTRYFMHVDAMSTLKTSAFVKEGLRMSSGMSILSAISSIRRDSRQQYHRLGK